MTSLLPHVLPFVLYLAIPAALGSVLGPWTDAARAVAAAAALLFFGLRGAYPELRVTPTRGQAVVGLLLGVAVAFLWVPLALAVPALSTSGRTGLDPASGAALVGFRLFGMVLVVPFAEELLTRSALPRFFDAKAGEDWRKLPVGAFTAFSAAASVAFFTIGHPEWLAALVTGVLWTVLLLKTRNLRIVVLSHAVANAVLALYVIRSGDSRWW